jgi:hypothetical protein
LILQQEDSSIYDGIVNVQEDAPFFKTERGDVFADTPTNLEAIGYDADNDAATKADGVIIFSWDHVSVGATYDLWYRKSTTENWTKRTVTPENEDDERVQISIKGFQASTPNAGT